MSWKSFACVAALSAIIAAPALAAPSLSFIDNEDGTVTLQVTPTGTGSIATEVFVSADFDLTTAVMDNSAVFDYENTGNNPITSTITTGLQNDLGNDQLFASHGSIVFNSSAAVNYLTIGYTGVGTISASGSLLAEGGENFTGLSASIEIDPDLLGDADGNGQVDGNDLLAVQTNFGNISPPTPLLGDADHNGQVDGNDLLAVQTNFGNVASSATAVPEPASILTLMVAFASCGLGLRVRS